MGETGETGMSDPTHEPSSPFKSRSGLQRIWRAAGYSWAGLKAAFRHEAAFRQELLLGLPMLAAVPFVAPGRWQAIALVAAVVQVWVVELLNSAVETLADALSAEPHALIGRAKDIGSAAVLVSLLLAVATWVLVLWP